MLIGELPVVTQVFVLGIFSTLGFALSVMTVSQTVTCLMLREWVFGFLFGMIALLCVVFTGAVGYPFATLVYSLF